MVLEWVKEVCSDIVVLVMAIALGNDRRLVAVLHVHAETESNSIMAPGWR